MKFSAGKEQEMMTPIRSILIVCLFHALGPSAFMWPAQGPFLQPLGPAQIAQSCADLKKTSVTISTDKSIYLPGEVIRITFAVANTTTGVLSVLDPFDIGVSGGVDVWRLDSKAVPPEWRPTAPHPNCENPWRGVTPEIPLVQIPAGRKTELTLVSYESLRGDPRPLVSESGSPLFPGEYKIVYNLPSRPEARFTVEPVIFEAVARIPLSGSVPNPAPVRKTLPASAKQRTSYQLAVYCAAVRSSRGRWIVINPTERFLGSSEFLSKPGEPMTYGDLQSLRGHVIVASPENAIVSLSGRAAPDDTISLTWTDSTGKRGTMTLDKPRKLIP